MVEDGNSVAVLLSIMCEATYIVRLTAIANTCMYDIVEQTNKKYISRTHGLGLLALWLIILLAINTCRFHTIGCRALAFTTYGYCGAPPLQVPYSRKPSRENISGESINSRTLWHNIAELFCYRAGSIKTQAWLMATDPLKLLFFFLPWDSCYMMFISPLTLISSDDFMIPVFTLNKATSTSYSLHCLYHVVWDHPHSAHVMLGQEQHRNIINVQSRGWVREWVQRVKAFDQSKVSETAKRA